MTCSFEGCGRPALLSRGLCTAHTKQFVRGSELALLGGAVLAEGRQVRRLLGMERVSGAEGIRTDQCRPRRATQHARILMGASFRSRARREDGPSPLRQPALRQPRPPLDRDRRGEHGGHDREGTPEVRQARPRAESSALLAGRHWRLKTHIEPAEHGPPLSASGLPGVPTDRVASR